MISFITKTHYYTITKALHLCVFMLLFANVNANSLESIETRISLDLKDTPLETVFSKIALQSDFNFFYNNSTVDLNRLVTIRVKNQPIDVILSKILRKNFTTYKIINKQIVIKRALLKAEIKSYKIKGKIIDKTIGTVIPYCSIYPEKSYTGTSSNELGEFEIETNTLPVQLVFSHLSYEKKIINITDSNTDLIVELIPLTNVLKEVVLKTVGRKKDTYAINLAKKAYKKIRLLSSNNKSQYARGFFRQKSKNDDSYSELSEIIYDINYNTKGVEKWNIIQGRYALKEKKINNKNYTLFSRILKSYQPDTKDVIFPLNQDLEYYYNVRIEDMFASDKGKIAIVIFTPKKEVKTPIFHGEAYINTSTYEVLKISGEIFGDDLKFVRLKEKNTFKKNYQLSYEMTFKSDSTQTQLINYIKVDQEFDYYKNGQLQTHVSTTSNLTFFEYYNPSSRIKLGRQFKRNESDWGKLNLIGYDKEFWDNNPIIKRTPVEKEVIAEFEKQNAFESIFMNSKEQISSFHDISKDSFITEIDTVVKGYNYYNPIEKVFLHIDKNMVDVGDKLWYSAYTVIGPGHYYSEGSKSLHVDIVDKSNQILFSQKLKIAAGKSKGSIVIPTNIPSGNYQLRAYTDWMRNYDPNLIFKKTLTIFNPEIINDQINLDENKIDLQFFPEGGNAIAGLTNHFAFKAIGSDGFARGIKGKIVDSQGNEIVQIKSNEQGMGDFNLKPFIGGQYTAVLDDNSRYPLPKILSNGYAILVDNINPQSMRIRIQASNDLKKQPFYLIGHSRNQRIFQGKYSFQGKSLVHIEIPKNRLPSGVTTLTLFDQNMKPWSERVAFVNNQQELIINTEVLKTDLTEKGETTVKINVKDPDGMPVSTNLSIAITNPNTVQKNSCDSNILTHLLLESDIKGHIENPAKYFKNDSRISKYNLDLIMLTNGWRRFNWQKLKESKFDTIKNFYFPKGFSISGIAKKKDNTLLGNTSLHMVVTSKDKIRYYATKTSPDGSFNFDNIDHIGSMDIKFSAHNKNPIDVKIIFDTPENPIQLLPTLPNFNKLKLTQTNNINTISNSKINSNLNINSDGKATLLDEVELVGRNANNKLERIKATPSHYGVEPDATVYIDDKYSNFIDALNEIPGVQTYGNSVKFVRHDGSPLWIVDGMEYPSEGRVTTASSASGTAGSGPGGVEVSGKASAITTSTGTIPLFVSTLTSNDVERIEVIKRAEAMYGMRGANGVILVYTKRGSTGVSKISAPEFTISGFSEEKEFYNPKYKADPNKNSIQNYKNTIYWNSSIVTDKNGNATIKLNNISNKKIMQISIEALSDYGVPGTYLQTFGDK